MDASTGGNAQAGVLRKAMASGSLWIPTRAGVHCHPDTFISAVTRPMRGTHRMCVAENCRKVDS
ncbi:hypothetical protein J2X02_000840 [Pseudoxanthomonas japonensis]|nr:hypothetical protein [Pseudoxanthomonas japonensis]